MLFYKVNTTYRVRIESVVLTQIGKKNTDAIAFGITVLGTVNAAGEVDECEQKRREVVKWLSDKAAENTIKDLIRLGYQHNDLEHLSELEQLEVNAYMQEQKDQEGKPTGYEQWNFSLGGGERSHKPLEQNEQMKLKALFGKKFAEVRATQVTRPVKPASPASTTPAPTTGEKTSETPHGGGTATLEVDEDRF